MKIVGLTGSIGMGKSTVAEMFRELGAAIWSADDAVHRLYARGGAAVAPMKKLFPDAVVDGVVDRDRLGALVFNDREALGKLEAIVHPLVAEDRIGFIEDARARGAAAAIMDIPLLFETGQQDAFDAVVVVSAREDVQRRRVLERPGMTDAKLNAILKRQMPDSEKRQYADYIIPTDIAMAETMAAVKTVYDQILEREKPV